MKSAALLVAALALPLAGCFETVVPPNLARLEVGKPAPAFSVVDADGATRTLAEFAGKTVVLEWNNPKCPFVKKHYDGNMQAQQKAARAQGVVWLSINSGKPGKQGHMDGEEAKEYLADHEASPTAYLLDGDSATGIAYGAKTTPHMYVIDGGGTLRYMGAIDSHNSSDPDDVAGATQYVTQALAELAAGREVSVPVTQPYGCSVKY